MTEELQTMLQVARIRKAHNQLTMSDKGAVFAEANYCFTYYV